LDRERNEINTKKEGMSDRERRKRKKVEQGRKKEREREGGREKDGEKMWQGTRDRQR